MTLFFLFASGILSFIEVFNWVLMRPMINFILMLSSIIPPVLGNLGLSIIVLTIVIMVLIEPFYRKQLQSTKKMREVQPKLAELKKKYGNDQQQYAQAQWRLYKEQGINPIGCSGAMIIQMPIWIAVYRAVMECLAYAPENMFGLSQQLYAWAPLHKTIPLNNHFLWLDLGQGNIILAVIVVITFGMMMKMTSQTTGAGAGVNDQQQTMQNMMQWMMPLVMGWMTITLPSGLGLYWFVSNALRIGVQYRMDGWGGLAGFSLRGSISNMFKKQPDAKKGTVIVSKSAKKRSGTKVSTESQHSKAQDENIIENEEIGEGESPPKRRKVSNGSHRDKRKVGRRSRRSGPR